MGGEPQRYSNDVGGSYPDPNQSALTVTISSCNTDVTTLPIQRWSLFPLLLGSGLATGQSKSSVQSCLHSASWNPETSMMQRHPSEQLAQSLDKLVRSLWPIRGQRLHEWSQVTRAEEFLGCHSTETCGVINQCHCKALNFGTVCYAAIATCSIRERILPEEGRLMQRS